MLAKPEHLDLPLLELKLLKGHILLLDDLYGNFLTSLPFNCKLYKTKFTFSKVLLKYVMVIHISIQREAFYLVYPVFSLLLCLAEVKSNFVNR